MKSKRTVDKCQMAPLSLKIPFTPTEATRFRAFLDAEGLIAGRWVGALIMRALNEAQRSATPPAGPTS